MRPQRHSTQTVMGQAKIKASVKQKKVAIALGWKIMANGKWLNPVPNRLTGCQHSYDFIGMVTLLKARGDYTAQGHYWHLAKTKMP